MKAKRATDILDDIDHHNKESGFPHLDHMYSGKFSEYYHRRLDMALSEAEISPENDVLELGGGTGLFAASLAEYANDTYFIDIPKGEPFFDTPKKTSKVGWGP